LTGARYHFRNDKRAAEPSTCDAGIASNIRGQEKRQCVKLPPNEVVLADGSVYDAIGLENEAIDTLIAFAYNGSSAAVIPAVYRQISGALIEG
jgi:hypothetical protein